MQPLPSSQPPSGFTRVGEWALDTPAGLSGLRAGLFRALTGRAVSGSSGLGSVPDRMVLVASELATNALKHGRPPTTVVLFRDGEECLLVVSDHDPDTVPVLAEPREPGEGGHGLRLAHKLSLEVGWFVAGDRKHIWATFPVAGASVGQLNAP